MDEITTGARLRPLRRWRGMTQVSSAARTSAPTGSNPTRA